MPKTKLDMLAEVLEIAKDGTTKTKIVTQANLNQKLATHMLSLMTDLDLLAATQKNPIHYCTTERGFRLLCEYRNLRKLLDSELNLQEAF